MKKARLNPAIKCIASVCFAWGFLQAAPAYAVTGEANETNLQAPQQRTVKGVVVDANGEPIIGATVRESGTQSATITDIDGNFSLNVSKAKAKLHITMVGYKAQDVEAAAGGSVNVTLEEDAAMLEELVVVGYGVQRKGDITSSIASVKAEDFNNGKVGDAAELIKGKVAGLSIVNSSGDPNSSSAIQLRGTTTLVGSTTPLILVDGIEGDLKTVAPENIESIDVLKDASAAAIYGTRGANGVILITTKSGRRGETATVTYSNYFSWSNWSRKAEFMDTHDVIYGNTQFPYEGYDTDWLAAISRKAGFKHNHSLSLSGGTKNATYAANISYYRDWGILRASGNHGAKAQLDYTQYIWNDILKVNVNGLFSTNKYDINNNAVAYGAYRQAVIRNPSSPIYNEDGSYNEDFNRLQYYNPVEIQNEYFGNNRTKFMQIVGNITLTPLKGWDNKLMISWGEGTSTSETWTSPRYYSLATQSSDINNGIANKSEGNWVSKNLEFTSTYHNNFGDHRLEALVGYSYLYEENDGFNAGNQNFSTEAFLWNNLGNGSFINDEKKHAWMGSYRNSRKLVGFFGRISYGYADRYNLLVSLRHEGSSKFGANHKWATFPSVSAGWTVTNEKFMKNTKKWLDNLKLRVGYGVTGIEPTSSYMSQNLYNFANWGDVLSMDGKWVKTIEVSQNVNPDLRWEKTSEINVGLDFSFLKGRIWGSVDFYVKTTKDLLYWYAMPMPPYMYGSTLANVGEMRNTGVEIMLSALPVKNKNFSWETNLTLSHNSNKLLSLNNDFYQTDNFLEVGGVSDPISVPTHCMEVGQPLGDFWGLKSVGVDAEGFVLVEAKDADGNWTVKRFNANLNNKTNRQRLGSGTPTIVMGWNNTLRYKGFDLNLQFTGQFGNKILNAQRCFYENNSIAYNRLKTANNLYAAINMDGTPALDENGNQIYTKLSSSMGQGVWSDHLENGNFFKLTNATLGYTIPFKGAIKRFISNARVYVSSTNLFCITAYSGIDPEVSNYFMAPGVDDRDKYPTTRSFTFGMQLNF
ncbi:MAG: TonB-dependent receptor [Bacteroidaceae bacterium]|nr:TonB-dependent receptor [Bacteroidaceae bacterium]